MSHMHEVNIFLKELNVTNFDTSNVIDLSWLFLDWNSLEKIDVSNFVTDKVQNMSHLFENCGSLSKCF